MKKIISILMLIMLSLCLFGCSGNKTENDPSGNNNNTPEENTAKENEWLCTKETYYYSDGSIDYYVINNYDEGGKFFSLEEYDADNNLLSSGKSEYDDKGREIVYETYDENGDLDLRLEYEYDDKDQLIKETDYYYDGTPADYYVFEYDDRGNRTRMENTTEDGFLSYLSEFEYDEKDRVVKAHYTFYGYDEWTYVYEYEGENEGPAKLIMYNSDNSIDKIAYYSYNSQDPKLADSMEYCDSENNLMYRYEFRYDEYGNEISEATFDPQGNMLSMSEYEYKKK